MARRYLLAAPLLLLLLAATGCGARHYPVHGTVTLEDGTPVTAGTVAFEPKDSDSSFSARGELDSQGRFEIGTNRPGDGIPAGTYRVMVAPPPQNPDGPPVKPQFDTRFARFETSGLEFEVKSGASEYLIKVTRPGK
jgi:hypothetical protein